MGGITINVNLQGVSTARDIANGIDTSIAIARSQGWRPSNKGLGMA
jgi:hypothetical protein